MTLRTAMRLFPWRALVPIAALALLLLLYYHPVVVSGKTFLTAGQTPGALVTGPYGMDKNSPRQVFDPGASAWQEEPWTFLARELVRAGQPPLWNPYYGLGAPIIGNIQAAPFYPTKLWVYLLPFELGWDLHIFSRLLLAALFTYLFARALHLSRAASLLAGTAFVLSGPLVTDYNIFWMGAYVFLPAQLLCLERHLVSGRRRWLVLGALATVAGLAAGNPQPTILATLVAGLYYVVGRARLGLAPGRSWRWRLRAALFASGALAQVAVLCALFGAFLLLPFLETVASSDVSHNPGVGFAIWEWRDWALPVLLPELLPEGDFGRVVALGTSAFLLAGVGAVAPPAGMRWRAVFLAALSVVALGKLFGFAGVQWLGALPVLDRIIFTRYAPPLAAFGVALLAGMGLERLRERRMPWLPLLASVAGLVAYGLAAWLTRPSPPSLTRFLAMAAALAPLVGLAFLVLAARVRPRLGPMATLAPIAGLALWSYVLLSPKDLPPRLFPYAEPPFVGWLRERMSSAGRVLSLDSTLYPNTSSAFAVPNLSLLDAIYPRRVARLARYLEPGFDGGLDPFRIPTRYTRDHVPPIWERPVLDLLGVQYLLARLELESPPLQEALLVAAHRAVTEKRCYAADPQTYQIGDMTRDLLFFHPPCVVEQTLAVPEDALALEFSLGLDPKVWSAEKGDGIRFRVSVQAREGEPLVVDEYLNPKANPADRRWSFHRVPLRGLRGRDVVLRLETDPGPRGDNGWDWGGFADLGVTAESEGDPTIRRWEREYSDEAKIYRNRKALPRAFIVGRARLAASGDEAFQEIIRGDFDPRAEVIFDPEGPAPLALPSRGTAAGADVYPDPGFTVYESARVRLSTATARDGYLVLSDVHYPGWRATIDGREVPIYQGDFLLRVIELPAGEHVVEFVYDPVSVKAGLGITLGAGLVLALVLVRRSRLVRFPGARDP